MLGYSLIGCGVYIFLRWAVERNRKRKRRSGKTWWNWFLSELDEWLATLGGAIGFAFLGDGLIMGSITFIGHFNFLTREELISIYVDNEALIFIIGGATFGTMFLLALKYAFARAERKSRS